MSPAFPYPHKLQYATLSSKINLKDFDCADNDLNDFIKNDALGYQLKYLANTTCVFFDDKLVGFYSLAADALNLEGSEKDGVEKHLRTYPAIKLARMALDKTHQGAGLGTLIVEIIKGFAVDLNQKGIAIRFITVDAYPQKLGFYTKCGFLPNHTNKAKKSHTISMRYDIFK